MFKTTDRLIAIPFHQYLSSDDMIVFIDKEMSRYIGYIDYSIDKKTKEAHISYMEVYPRLKRKGYGKEMYTWFENKMKKLGIKVITLTAIDESISFWRAMKFKGESSMEKKLR